MNNKFELSVKKIFKCIFSSNGISLIAALATLATVREMQIDRETAYMPDIVMHPIEISFTWDENGVEDWLPYYNVEHTMNIKEDGSVEGEIEIPITLTIKDNFLFNVVNIGEGTAKNIIFKWDENNMKRLKNYIISYDDKNEHFCQIGESIVFSYADNVLMMSREKNISAMYLAPDIEKGVTLALPNQYVVMINKAIKDGYLRESGEIVLTLIIEYEDIQGDKYKRLVGMLVNLQQVILNENGSGEAIYQIQPYVKEI